MKNSLSQWEFLKLDDANKWHRYTLLKENNENLRSALGSALSENQKLQETLGLKGDKLIAKQELNLKLSNKVKATRKHHSSGGNKRHKDTREIVDKAFNIFWDHMQTRQKITAKILMHETESHGYKIKLEESTYKKINTSLRYAWGIEKENFTLFSDIARRHRTK